MFSATAVTAMLPGSPLERSFAPVAVVGLRRSPVGNFPMIRPSSSPSTDGLSLIDPRVSDIFLRETGLTCQMDYYQAQVNRL